MQPRRLPLYQTEIRAHKTHLTRDARKVGSVAGDSPILGTPRFDGTLQGCRQKTCCVRPTGPA